MRLGASGGGEALEDVLEGDAEASFQAEGEDLNGDAALYGHSHAGADASVDGVGQGRPLLLRFEGGEWKQSPARGRGSGLLLAKCGRPG